MQVDRLGKIRNTGSLKLQTPNRKPQVSKYGEITA